MKQKTYVYDGKECGRVQKQTANTLYMGGTKIIVVDPISNVVVGVYDRRVIRTEMPLMVNVRYYKHHKNLEFYKIPYNPWE